MEKRRVDETKVIRVQRLCAVLLSVVLVVALAPDVSSAHSGTDAEHQAEAGVASADAAMPVFFAQAVGPPAVGSVVSTPTGVEIPPVPAPDVGVVVGGDVTSSGAGGWYVTDRGDVQTWGVASSVGSLADIELAAPIVAMVATASNRGYWLAASDGGVFAFGDAAFHGSAGNIDLRRPIVDIAAADDGSGYWLAADDGGVFAFGAAAFHGSMGGFSIDRQIVGMERSADGEGYWLVATDGGVFAFGTAPFVGSTGGQSLDVPMIDLIATADRRGYWIVSETGATNAFGSATREESVVADGRVVAAMATSDGIVTVQQPNRPTMSVWQSGGLESEVTLRILDAVARRGGAASVNHTGTVRWLALHRDGTEVRAATPGWQVPFTIRAVDPVETATFTGSDVSAALERGEIVMSERAARRQGARPGDTVSFVGWNERITHRVVGAIVADGRIASTELIVSIADAATFAFDRPSSVWVQGIEDSLAFEADLEAIATTADFVRWARSWDSPSLDGVLSTSTLKDLIGEFEYRHDGPVNITMEPAWVDEHIARETFPIIGAIWCNRAVFDDLHAALADVEAQGLAHLIDVADTRRHGGCWGPRRIRGSSGGSISRHAWGLAVDLNPATNPWGAEPTIDQRLVEIFRANGFAWGGTWTRPDGMHFEWRG